MNCEEAFEIIGVQGDQDFSEDGGEKMKKNLSRRTEA